MNDWSGSEDGGRVLPSMPRRAFLGVLGAAGFLTFGCEKSDSGLSSSSKAIDPKQLRDNLDGIKAWLEKNNPEVAASLQPGMSRREIEMITAEMPFALPDEVVLLYQWYNGTSIDAPFIWNYRFLPIEDAALFWKKNERSGWLNKFPMFAHRGQYYFVAPFGIAVKSLPVRHFSPKNTDHPNAFLNVTVMAQTALEWYKSGAVKVGKAPNLRAVNMEKIREIHEKLNPDTLFPEEQ